MLVILLTAYCWALAAQPTEIYDVIVVGAGAAGIAASKVLNQKRISHIIIESRNRIGGRIVSGQVDGVTVDLGATFVHSPYYHNPIH